MRLSYSLSFVVAFSLLTVFATLSSTRPASADLESRMTPLVRAVASARPAVVNIHGRKTVREQVNNYSQIDKQVNGMGTGVVIDERGYIITNYHVIEGVAQIRVTLHDQTETTARLVAHDPVTDLAIIKISTSEPLATIEIGNSDTLMPAETVAAVGNAYGYEHTVTRGIVSELRRTVQVSEDQIYHNLIQTDASINPGNSGGPLLNIDGEMIGINVAVRVGAQGIGFAIPSNDALEIAARLMGEHVSLGSYHGIRATTKYSADGTSSVVVQSVERDGAASNAGIRQGDEIVSIDDFELERSLDLERALLGIELGQEIEFKIRRDDDLQTAIVAIDQQPASNNQVLCWSRLGLRLATIDSNQFETRSSPYNGGMQVTAVRPNSPAEQQGIRTGDILVGMHVWETVSYENVAYVLTRPEFISNQAFRFYILRGSETLWGNIQLASR